MKRNLNTASLIFFLWFDNYLNRQIFSCLILGFVFVLLLFSKLYISMYVEYLQLEILLINNKVILMILVARGHNFGQ